MISITTRTPWVKAALVFSLIVAATLVLYSRALGNWWCCDDTQILKHAVQYSPYEYFFVPAAWRALIVSSLTPWLSSSPTWYPMRLIPVGASRCAWAMITGGVLLPCRSWLGH